MLGQRHFSHVLSNPPPSAPQTPPFHKQGACVCWLGATFPMFCHGNPPTSSPQLHWLQGTSFPGDFTSSWAWLIFFWETLVMGIGWAVSVFKLLCITDSDSLLTFSPWVGFKRLGVWCLVCRLCDIGWGCVWSRKWRCVCRMLEAGWGVRSLTDPVPPLFLLLILRLNNGAKEGRIVFLYLCLWFSIPVSSCKNLSKMLCSLFIVPFFFQ